MIEVDGSQGEGGGQVLRTSLALAAALGKNIRISNIRAGREKPGIQAQHFTAVSALGKISNASVDGLKVGSTELVFKPRNLVGGAFRFDVGTAGSVTLVLQALMPVLPFAPSINLELHGGTDVKWSPPIDYLRLVALPVLAGMGVNLTLQILRRGHYPKGGGIVKSTSTPFSPLNPINGRIKGVISEIVGVSHSVKLPRDVAERQATSASQVIAVKDLPAPRIEVEAADRSDSLGPGSGIVLAARAGNQCVLGGDSLGERGKPAEAVGQDAGETLLEEISSKCFLDRHMGDIIVPYMVLAEGVSDVTLSQITRHALTNVKIAEAVADAYFETIGEIGRAGRLRVKGVGLKATGSAASAKESIPTQSL